jgi:cytochrome d ubiquinol oxidase subunit II
MPLEDLVAAAGLIGAMLYGALGGADFGGGIWDLFAGGCRTATRIGCRSGS